MSGQFPYVVTPVVPPKIQAAQQFLYFANMVRNPQSHFEGVPAQPQDLSPKEQSTYDAALSALRMYFTGELDFATVFEMDEDDDEDDASPNSKYPSPSLN